MTQLREASKALLLLRKEGLMADFKIVSQGTIINVHKAILAGKKVFNYVF